MGQVVEIGKLTDTMAVLDYCGFIYYTNTSSYYYNNFKTSIKFKKFKTTIILYINDYK